MWDLLSEFVPKSLQFHRLLWSMQAFFNTVCNLRQLLKPCLGTCFRSKGLPHQGRWVVECRQTPKFHHHRSLLYHKHQNWFSSSFPFLLFRHTLSTWQNDKEKMTDGSRVTDKDSKASEEEQINSSHEKGSKWRLWPFFLLHLSSGLSGTSCKLSKSENYISVHWKHCQLSTCLLAITGTKYFFFSS